MRRRTAEKIFKGVDCNNREEVTEMYIMVRDRLLRRLEREHFDKEKKKISKYLATLEKAYNLLVEFKPIKNKMDIRKAAIKPKNFILTLSKVLLLLFAIARFSHSCD